MQVAISTAPTKRRNFIDLRILYLKHQTHKGAIAVSYVSSEEKIVDILTKPLCKQAYPQFIPKLQLTDRHEDKSQGLALSTEGVS